MANEILTAAIDDVASGSDLDAERAEAVLDEIMAGRGSAVQSAALLIALRTKGETPGELVGFARAMRSLATPVESGRADLVDTCGTGGGPTTYNVSTVAGLIAAGAGCAVAKHGNRSNTSASGSADLLEALGLRLDLPPEAVARCIDEAGFGFMFAPVHHAAMANVIEVRRELAVRTVFNFLGPLTNPAGARRQVIGIADTGFQETVAEALAGLGCERGWVVSAEDGMDELSTEAPSRVIAVEDGQTSELRVEPSELDLSTGARPSSGDGDRGAAGGAVAAGSIQGGTPEQNAEIANAVLSGAAGPARDLAVLNAAAAIHVAGRAADLVEGIERANESIDSGAARAVLERLLGIAGSGVGSHG